ncbi:hypothetical protein [Methylorubrum populi]|uniref:hypothetical protein n=1 Tax=Methylorubrum populi TaxID=223967 RepID=UPI003F65FD0D
MRSFAGIGRPASAAFQASATSVAASRRDRPTSISVLAMAPPPRFDGLDEIIEQLTDTGETIRHFPAIMVPVIALAPLVVEADNLHPVHDVDKTVLEAVCRGWNRLRSAPYHRFREISVAEDDTSAGDERRPRVGML